MFASSREMSLHSFQCWDSAQSDLPGSWHKLPVPVQVKILALLPPSQALQLVCVSRQFGRMALAVTRQLEAPPTTTAQQGLAKGLTAPKKSPASLKKQQQSFVLWLRKHGHRLQKLVITAGSASELDEILGALSTASEANTKRRSAVQKLLRSFDYPMKAPLLISTPGEANEGDAAATVTITAPAAGYKRSDSSGSSSSTGSGSGSSCPLCLQHLELRTVFGACLSRSTAAKLGRIFALAPAGLKVTIVHQQ